MRKNVLGMGVIIILVGLTYAYAFPGDLLYSFTVKNDGGILTNSDIILINGEMPKYFFDRPTYNLKVISFKKKILFNLSFDFEFTKNYALKPEWFDKEGNQIYFPEDVENIDKMAVRNLIIPYYPNAEKIEISKGEELKLEIDVSSFATCNENNICDNKETHELCPEECLCGNGNCDPGESYQTCSQDCPYIPAESESLNIWRRILIFIKAIIARV